VAVTLPLKVTVTEQHVKRAIEFVKDDEAPPRSTCCPVSLALYDALNRPFDPIRIENNGAEIWSARFQIGIDGTSYATPDVVTEIIAWFDGNAEPDRFTFPVSFEINEVIA
jgi:hypothetical protein